MIGTRRMILKLWLLYGVGGMAGITTHAGLWWLAWLCAIVGVAVMCWIWLFPDLEIRPPYTEMSMFRDVDRQNPPQGGSGITRSRTVLHVEVNESEEG